MVLYATPHCTNVIKPKYKMNFEILIYLSVSFTLSDIQ